MLHRLLWRVRIPFGHGMENLRSLSSSSVGDNILIHETRTKVLLTINRPKVLNAVSMEMIARFYWLLRNVQHTKMLVIIKGAGDKSFSVGGDVGEIAKSDLITTKNCFRNVYSTSHLIANYKIPFIALIDGLTMGGGVGLSVHARYCIATERTVFAMPEAGIGLFPDIGSSYFLPRLDGKLGFYLGLTGQRLIGEDVLKAGLATHFCESSKLGELESELLKCTNRSDVPSIVKRFASTTSKERDLAPHIDSIKKCFSGATVEEIFQNLERDGSEWAIGTLNILKQKSPVSLKITHRQLQEGKNLSLAEGLKMEYRMVCRCLENTDFYEGVRALLIDKDKSPKWNPSRIEDISEEEVAKYFAKLPEKEELKFDP